MSNFETTFLENYLKLGLGSMPKTDIDSLVMYLLDNYGLNNSAPLASYSNQTVSEILKTPVTKIKKLRYEAALKFGGRIEDQAMGRVLAALSKASLEPEGNKICLIIEDTLAKNWLQGQLKIHQYIYDYSFNTEIIKVSSDGLFKVLDSVFDQKEIEKFREGYKNALKKKNTQERANSFRRISKKFAEGAAKAAGKGVIDVLKSQIGT